MADLERSVISPFIASLRDAPSPARMIYDQEADVLYVNFGEPVAATDSELREDDIIVRYKDDEVIGYTILHASIRE